MAEPHMAVMEGSMAVAQAVRAARPGVISAYPITPQTHLVEHLAQMVADGELDTRYIRADSEFSAASIVCGASAAGVRAYTASASQGLALMTEVIYNMAGLRLPVVLTDANRQLSAPIGLQPDHQDTLLLRDSGADRIVRGERPGSLRHAPAGLPDCLRLYRAAAGDRVPGRLHPDARLRAGTDVAAGDCRRVLAAAPAPSLAYAGASGSVRLIH